MDAADLALADQVAQQMARLGRVAGHVRRHRDVAVVAHVLARFVEAGPRRVGALAGALGTDPSTASRQVTALVAAGLVERRADDVHERDRRMCRRSGGDN